MVMTLDDVITYSNFSRRSSFQLPKLDIHSLIHCILANLNGSSTCSLLWSLLQGIMKMQLNVLLGNFTPKNVTVKEFSVNVTLRDLVITISPLSYSFAYVNALEVVFVPDILITDDASTISAAGTFSGMYVRALEQVWRTWVTDQSFLTQRSSAKSINKIAYVKYPQNGATPDIAPHTVYGICSKMNVADTGNDPNINFNVTWTFNVLPGFHYFIRLHFYDIVSTFMSTPGTWLMILILVRKCGDFWPQLLSTIILLHLLKVIVLTLVLAPSPRSGFPDAFLNGLELQFSTMVRVSFIVTIIMQMSFLA